MEELAIPIFRKCYDLYKTFYGCRSTAPKQDRFTLWQRVETVTLAVIEHLLLASQRGGQAKREPLEQASVELNLLRLLVRLAKDTRVIDLKRYAQIQQSIDEAGRMLGGWLRSISVGNSRQPYSRNP